MNKIAVLVLVALMMGLSACVNTDKSSVSQSEVIATKVNFKTGKIQDISNQELQQLLDKGVVLVDIRLPQEWQETGIVAGSRTLTLFDESGKIEPTFLDTFQQWVKPEQPVILICRSGNRSRVGAELLVQQAGYQQVYNVTDGINQWLAEGRRVVKP